jgi:hypothetical protein
MLPYAVGTPVVLYDAVKPLTFASAATVIVAGVAFLFLAT